MGARLSRVLRSFAVLFMVPMIVVTASDTARASEALASNTLRFQLEGGASHLLTGGKWRSSPECIAQVDASEVGLSIHTGYCDIGVTPDGICEPLDPSCTALEVQYKGPGGCTLTQPVHLERFSDGWFTNRVYISSPARSLGACAVATVCLVVDWKPSAWPDSHYSGCVPLGMESPVDPLEGMECVHGAWEELEIYGESYRYWGSSGVQKAWAQDSRFVIRSEVGQHQANDWLYYVVRRPLAGGPIGVDWSRNSADVLALMERELTSKLSPDAFHNVTGAQNPPTSEVVGAGIAWVRGVNFIASNFINTPNNHSQGVVGKNSPGSCAFYLGEKLWDDGAPGGPDEPGGPLPVPYEPDVNKTLPDDLDVSGGPATQESFWGAVVDALKRLMDGIRDLANAIAGLVKGIVDGITGLLKELFIPDPDSWDLNGLLSQMRQRPPFSLAEGMAVSVNSFGSHYSSSGSCGTLVEFGPSMKLDCAQIRAIPGYGGLYVLVQIALVSMTLMGIWNMVASTIERGQ